MNKIFYHGSPTQNIKSFNSNSFITPNKSFAACYGVLWSDGEAYQINHNGRIYFAIEDESKLSNSCSLYSIKVDPRLIKKYNSDEYILSTRKYNILDEYQYSSFQKMLETNGVILLTMDVFKSKFHKYIKESYGIFESVEFLNESNMEDINIELKKSHGDFYDILNNNKKVGTIGLSFYEDIKAIGLGSFEIDSSLRGKGLGSATIKHIIKTYKKDYDLIYCYVEPKNTGAIKLYKKLGKVYDDTVNKDGYHYVVFYEKSKK